jgi:uncharacterized integral membrane protein
MDPQRETPPPGGSAKTSSGGAFTRSLRFVTRHPLRVAQAVFFTLVGIVVLQNLESTSFDVLFWSIPTFPKLVLIFLSMGVGAVAWEIARRLLGR